MANRDGSKSGGRKKGTPNKETINATTIADRLGVDPFEVLLNIVNADWKALGYEAEYTESVFGRSYHITPTMRLKAAAEATKYLYPQRKAVELKNNDGLVPVVLVKLPTNGREKKD